MIFIGICIGCVSYILFYVGLVLQKKGASQVDPIESTVLLTSVKNFCSNKPWVIGQILCNIYIYVYLLALTMAPLSIIGSLNVVGLIVLIVVSHFYLKEKVTKNVVYGIGMIMVGIVFYEIAGSLSTLFYENQEEVIMGIEETNEIMLSFKNIGFIIMIIVAVIIGVCICIFCKFKYADVVFGISSGMMSGIASVFSKSLSNGFAEGFGFNVILNIIKNWQSWMYIIILTGGNFSCTVLQQIGFQKGSAIVVCPLTSLSNSLIGILGGVIVFEEWKNDFLGFILLKVVLLCVVVYGVFLLTRKEEDKNQNTKGFSAVQETINELFEESDVASIEDDDDTQLINEKESQLDNNKGSDNKI